MIWVFNNKEELVGVLTNDSPAGIPYWDDLHKERLEDGWLTYEFTCPAEGTEFIEADGYVVIKDLDKKDVVFRIREVSEETRGKQRVRKVSAENAALELNGRYIRPQTLLGATAEQFLTVILQGTRWQPGFVDFLGTADIKIEDYITVTAGLQMLREKFGGEIEYVCNVDGGKIAGRIINVYKQRGNATGKRFEYSKDLVEVRRTVDMSNVKTALIGLGKPDPKGRRITFANVSWSIANGDPADKPLGQDWVGDEEALERYGKDGYHLEGVYQNDEIDDPYLLLRLTWDELQKRKNPSVTYEVNVVALERLAGYEAEKVRLGDTVTVVDTEFDPPLVLEARVLEIERSYSTPTKDKVVLGNFRDIAQPIPKKVQEMQKILLGKKKAWDAKEYVPKQTAPPSNPEIGDLWLNTSTTPNVLMRYDGTQWVKAAATDFSEISGTVTSGQIADGAVTDTKIANSAVTTDKIADGAIIGTKISAGAIDSTKVTDGAITTPKLAASAVTADKIAAGSITTNHIAADGIDAGVIKTGTMVADRIRGGVLSIGGDQNSLGIIQILNWDGTVRATFTASGIYLLDAPPVLLQDDSLYGLQLANINAPNHPYIGQVIAQLFANSASQTSLYLGQPGTDTNQTNKYNADFVIYGDPLYVYNSGSTPAEWIEWQELFRIYGNASGVVMPVGTFKAPIIEATAGGGALKIRPGSNDHCYIEFYPDSQATTTRGAWMGYGSAGTTVFTIAQQVAGNVNISIPSGYDLFVNGNRVRHEGNYSRFSFVAAYLNSAVSLAASTWTKIVCNAESLDYTGEYDPTTGRFTASKAGVYLVSWKVSFQTPPAGNQYQSAIYKNGVRFAIGNVGTASGSYSVASTGCVPVPMIPGDYIELYGFTGPNGPVNLNYGSLAETSFWVAKVS